jgi:hypothetical protein
MTNPGPATTINPPSIMANFVPSGTSTQYTFATLPAAANFAVGFMAETSDQGMCHIVLVNGVLTWVVLGVPQSGGAIQRQINNLQGMTNLTSFGQGSMSVQYLNQQWPVTATRADLLVSWAAANSATTNTAAIVISAYCAIYTNNTASSALSSVSSGSTQTTYTYASNSAGVTALQTAAIRPISVPINVSMTPGEYYVAFNFSTNSSSIGLSTTNLAQSISVMGFANNQTALNYAEFTAQTATGSNLYVQGIWTSAGTGLPGSVPYTQISQTGALFSAAQFAYVLRNY